jgi:transcriptional regulator with XRE-family HTH domain
MTLRADLRDAHGSPRLCASPISSGLVQDRCFGELLFDLRERQGVGQRQLARAAGIAASTVSQIENGRRSPPGESVVELLCDCLRASDFERKQLHRVARLERQSVGLRVARSTPRHVAELLREISRVSHRLSARQVERIRTNLTEVTMK